MGAKPTIYDDDYGDDRGVGTKTVWNSLYWFLRYGVRNFFGTHRLTDSDGHKRKQNASSAVGLRWRRHKNKIKWHMQLLDADWCLRRTCSTNWRCWRPLRFCWLCLGSACLRRRRCRTIGLRGTTCRWSLSGEFAERSSPRLFVSIKHTQCDAVMMCKHRTSDRKLTKYVQLSLPHRTKN